MSLRLSFRRYALPLRAPVRTAHGVWTTREGLLVRAEDETGAVGFGEVATLPDFGTETVAEAADVLTKLGAQPTQAELDAVPERCRCTRHALHTALAECGGNTPEAAAAHLSVAALLPAGRAVLAAVAAKAEAGFRVFKWKVGVGDPADELGLLDDLLAQLPGGARLRLDANGAWERRTAERWLERCAERPIEFVEQPISPTARGAADLLLGLAGDFPTPLALDESLVHEGDVARWLGAGWPGVFVIKPSLLAEPEVALAQLHRAKAAVVFSSALETVVGARAALRWAFAWQGEPRALGFGVWPLFADGRFDGPAALPFVHAIDVAKLNAEAAWNVLS